MNPASSLGKILIFAGLIFIIAGLILFFNVKIPWLGKLPGDIHIHRKNFSFYFPIVTCLLISAVVSIILMLCARK